MTDLVSHRDTAVASGSLSGTAGIAAQVLFAPFGWAAARQINRPLDGWRKILPAAIRPRLATLWPVTSSLGSISFLIGQFVAVTGYVPG